MDSLQTHAGDVVDPSVCFYERESARVPLFGDETVAVGLFDKRYPHV